MIQRILFLLMMMVVSIVGISQYVLKTPDGKTVRLHENGKWEFVNSSKNDGKKVPVTATAKYVSKNKKYVVWYDPNLWIVDTVKTVKGYWWDVTIYSQDYSTTANCLDSRLSLPADDSTTKITFEEIGAIKSFVPFTDTINGLAIAGYNVDVESNGVIYRYINFVHSTPRGSFQFLVGTQKEVFEEDREKILDLIRGINRNTEKAD